MTDTEKSGKESSERKKHKDSGQLFQPGKSGNPKGRPKGSKNQLTLLREAVRDKAEDLVLSNFTDVVEATIELAKQGDATALKILWDRIIPSKRAVEEKVEGQDKLNITINVEAMSVQPTEVIETNVVEAEFIEIPEDK